MFRLAWAILLCLSAILLLAVPTLSQQAKPAAKVDESTISKSEPQDRPSKIISHEDIDKQKQKETSSINVLPPDAFLLKAVAQEPSKTTQQPGGNDAADLSKKLANPVASLISFPIQTNFDFGMGTGSGWRNATNVQPVIPVALNKDWNLISRTIVPIIHQGNVVAQGTSQSGLGDTVQSLFLSPNKTEPFIWGAGPAILIPTATNDFLGSKQLGLGPTIVALKQQSGWTFGGLWNHIWRVGGRSSRPRVNSDFIQPFLAYSTKDGWTYTLNTESTYDWTGKSWSVPIHFVVAKVVRLGKQPVSFGGSVRCWATSPAGGPEGCGLRIVVTGIFPKK
jgi:hypothetical protein